MTKNRRAQKSWSHLDQALRATDLLLQVGDLPRWCWIWEVSIPHRA
jgi:hypothetical protein